MWGTTYFEILYQGRPRLDRVIDVHGFVDAHRVGYIYCRISTSGYVFNLFGRTISWMRKIHDVVALSNRQSEYMAATHASKEVVWIHRLFSIVVFVNKVVRLYTIDKVQLS